MEIEKALTAAQKAELKKEIQAFLQDEIYQVATTDLKPMAKEWMKKNKPWITDLVDKELRKRVASIIKGVYVEFPD